jgi:hypothetical protein
MHLMHLTHLNISHISCTSCEPIHLHIPLTCARFTPTLLLAGITWFGAEVGEVVATAEANEFYSVMFNSAKGRLQLADGLRSGSYEVTVVLPADGRWTVQIPFHLSSRSTATPRTPEVVEVTVNGNIDIREGRKAQTKILTTADVKKGKALTPGTRHALAFKIEGGSFTVKMDFSSAKTALSEHVLVGNAVASCTSSCTKGGHQPITPLDHSKVRTRLPPPPPPLF